MYHVYIEYSCIGLVAILARLQNSVSFIDVPWLNYFRFNNYSETCFSITFSVVLPAAKINLDLEVFAIKIKCSP